MNFADRDRVLAMGWIKSARTERVSPDGLTVLDADLAFAEGLGNLSKYIPMMDVEVRSPSVA